ncbi:MAG: PAS domain S-box protein [Gammaproteobacteria bacterium]|nr:PAS domain S-box protein [Gammaproteobacteria bacterium]
MTPRALNTLLLAACLALTLGIQLDWLIGVQLQGYIAVGNATTKFSTATMLQFIAVGLLSEISGKRRTAHVRLLGALVSAFALTFLLGFGTSGMVLLRAPSPATSAMCLLLGLTLILRNEGDRTSTGAALTGGVALLISFSGLFAWLTEPQLVPQLGPFSTMGIVTVVIGMVLGSIVLINDPGIPVGALLRHAGAAGQLFRRSMLAFFVLVVALGTYMRVHPGSDSNALLTYVFVALAIAVGAGFTGVVLLVQHLSRAEHASAVAVTAREASDAFADRVLSAVPNAILVVNEDGLIARANSHPGKLFHTSAANLVHMTVDELLPTESRTDHRQLRNEYNLRPTAREMGKGRLLRAQRLDGTTFPVEVGLNPLAAGTNKFTVVSIIDLTERIATELQLRAHADALERSNTELERFAFVASHDLKEPLRAVEGFSVMLRDECSAELGDRGNKWVVQIVDGAQRMRNLIDDLLLLSRVRTQELRFQPVDMNKLVHRVLEDFAQQLRQQHAALTVQNLPSVTGDAGMLQRLIGNLVSNALKYRSDQQPRISISCCCANDYWQFDVADNGMGIDEKFFQTIFEVFKRLHGRGKIEGTGMGLSICQSIVERHGGRIWVTSVAGIGSTFHFTLPTTASTISVKINEQDQP